MLLHSFAVGIVGARPSGRRPASDDARLAGRRSRTPDLQESLEYQTATSRVLNVISRLGAELATMLQTLVETGVRICNANRGAISPTEIERVLRMVGNDRERPADALSPHVVSADVVSPYVVSKLRGVSRIGVSRRLHRPTSFPAKPEPPLT